MITDDYFPQLSVILRLTGMGKTNFGQQFSSFYFLIICVEIQY